MRSMKGRGMKVHKVCGMLKVSSFLFLNFNVDHNLILMSHQERDYRPPQTASHPT